MLKSFQELFEAEERKYSKHTSKSFHNDITYSSKKYIDEGLSHLDFSKLHILDIGCGDGALSIYLAKKGAQVTSFDISSKAIELLKEHAKKEGVENNITTIVGNFYTYKFPKESFDLIFALGSLQSCSYQLKHLLLSIKKIKTWLKKKKSAVFFEIFSDSNSFQKKPFTDTNIDYLYHFPEDTAKTIRDIFSNFSSYYTIQKNYTEREEGFYETTAILFWAENFTNPL